ncbi:MAG: Gfo/Idh/MocA family oxidoreductase [Anaerolineae bacterium]|nr:Gfo/Idh/MocA family oxidoreductase [Anaerolineae bacterium]
MKFLIAGYGSIGRRHMRNLLALGERDIILYRTRRSTLPEDELKGFTVETDLQAALAHQPDAVIIANPTAKHLDVAIPAARAGCHLLMEKPISHSMERLDQLEEALRAGGGKVLVGFQFRFHPGLQRIGALLRDAAIGRPLSAYVHWGEYLPAWHPWEDYRQGYSARRDLGGGVTLTLCHPMDYCAALFGEAALEYAFVGKVSDLEIDVDDIAVMHLYHSSGVRATIHLDYFQQPASHHLEIIGTQGTIRWDNSDGVVHLYQAESASWKTFSPPQGFERNDMFLDEMRHFLAVIRGEEQSICTLEDGIRTLSLALQAMEYQA